MRRAWLSHPAARIVAGLVATAAILVPLSAMWVRSLVPATYSVMDMGYADYGGGPRAGHTHHAAGAGAAHAAAASSSHVTGEVSVASLTGPREGTPDVVATLVAREETFKLRSGEPVSGYTLNHSSPGPLLRARQGDLVQVTLVNANVSDGVTLHWHGIDVPNAEDGVAGVTQDAVGRGEKTVYRFIAEDAGTYWYHSHQVSHQQVKRGLFGAFIIDPSTTPAHTAATPGATKTAPKDVLAMAHTYAGKRTINGATGPQHITVPAGERVRLRTVNTDNGLFHAWVTGAAYELVAMDGFDLHEPTLVRDRTVLVAAGGRADLVLTTPADGSAVRVDLGGGGGTYLTIGARQEAVEAAPRPNREVDLMTYGSPRDIGFDPAAADRSFDYRIGRRPGFVDGRPGLWWSINGGLFPNVPMFVVAEGDIVRMTLKNKSGQVHPMHLHGHHAVVLSRNGVKATGTPWWVDSLNVADGETYEIAFRADNPGIWMDHCHNLSHAAEGLVAHLVYTGVTEPFVVGGKRHNHPE